ncbi:MAG: hypothetical protein WDZ88_02895 [Candidatus Paceibacterota bacterium]
MNEYSFSAIIETTYQQIKIIMAFVFNQSKIAAPFFNRTLLLLLFIAMVLCVNPHTLLAQSSTGIEIQPSFIEEGVNPGDVYSDVLRIKNLSSEEQTYFLTARNIRELDGSNTPVFADEGEVTEFEVASWVTIDQDSVIIPAGGEAQVPFSIIVPEDATPGSHLGGIFAGVRPPRLRETGAGVGFQVGTIISMKISGDVVELARIREFSSDKNIYGSALATFTLSVENQGNILVRPQGFIEINNMFGDTVAELKINDNAGAVLPKAEREFLVTWEGTNLSFGRYQINAGLVYGEYGRKNIEASMFIWVLPMKVILPFIGGLLFLVLVMYIGIRIHVHKKLKVAERRNVRMVHDEAPLSKLTLIAVVVLGFTVLFLASVFLLFA